MPIYSLEINHFNNIRSKNDNHNYFTKYIWARVERNGMKKNIQISNLNRILELYILMKF